MNCAICLAPGHLAWRLPSGSLVCPLKIEESTHATAPKDEDSASPTSPDLFTMSTQEALALRAVLTRLAQTPSMLHPDTAPEIRSLFTRLWRVEPLTPGGICRCKSVTKGVSSFHCGTCGKIVVFPH